MAEITSLDYPDERLVACRNPELACEQTRERDALLAATERDLARIAAAVPSRRRRIWKRQDEELHSNRQQLLALS